MVAVEYMAKFFAVFGAVIGKLTVVRLVGQDEIPEYVPICYRTQGPVYECLCECGNLAYYPQRFLEIGKVKSCGCIRAAMLRKGSAKAELKSRADDLRRQIKITQKTYRLHKARGTLERNPEIGDLLKKQFAELAKLGFVR